MTAYVVCPNGCNYTQEIEKLFDAPVICGACGEKLDEGSVMIPSKQAPPVLDSTRDAAEKKRAERQRYANPTPLLERGKRRKQ